MWRSRLGAAFLVAALCALAGSLRGAVAGPALLGAGPFPTGGPHRAPEGVWIAVRYLDGTGQWVTRRAHLTLAGREAVPLAARLAALYPGFRVQGGRGRFWLTQAPGPRALPFFLRAEGDRLVVAVGRWGSPFALDVAVLPVSVDRMPGWARAQVGPGRRLSSLEAAWRLVERTGGG